MLHYQTDPEKCIVYSALLKLPAEIRIMVILWNWKTSLYFPNQKIWKVKSIHPQRSFEIPVFDATMAITATKRQCFLCSFLHQGIWSAETGKNKIAIISFH